MSALSTTPAGATGATDGPGAAPGSTSAQRRRTGTRLVVAVLGATVLLFPLLWMVRTSLASPAELADLPVPLWPQDARWSNFVEPWREYPFARWLANSVVIAVASVALTVALNLAAGYAFAKLRFPCRDLLFLLIVSTLMVPVQVIMVPQFQVVVDAGLVDSPWGVVLPRLAEAFGLFLARQFFLGIPDELLDAAKMDGAGHVRTFRSIVLPLSGPLVAVLVIFTFMWRWNEFVWPLIVLTDAQSYTLPVGLQFLVQQYGTDYGPLLAMSLVSVLPMLLVFAIFQRYFVEGVARSGLR